MFRAEYLLTCSARSVGGNVSEDDGQKDKKLVGVKGMAEILGVKENWIYQRTRLNQIPYIKAGKYLRFDPDEVMAFFRSSHERLK